jgi:hypothetical protein
MTITLASFIVTQLQASGEPLSDMQEAALRGCVAGWLMTVRDAYKENLLALQAYNRAPTDINETLCVQSTQGVLRLIKP